MGDNTSAIGVGRKPEWIVRLKTIDKKKGG
jgi:hypothetical protein